MKHYHTDHADHEKHIILNRITMSLEDVFGSIDLTDPGKDLDQIIEEAKEEQVKRFLEKYNQDDTDFDAYPLVTCIEPL